MVREIIDSHPSVVVVYNPELEKFLLSVYDEGYPGKAYRLSANNIGGNPNPDDINPQGVLIRELGEEYDPNHADEKQFVGKVDWASEKDIRQIRNSLWGKIEPMQDFMIRQSEEIEGGNKPFKAIQSTYFAEVDEEIIRIVESNIERGLNIPTEGLSGVYSIGELMNHPRREFGTAHATAHTINWKFGSKIPQTRQISIEPLGLPRKSFGDYLADFEYDSENLKRASNAENFE